MFPLPSVELAHGQSWSILLFYTRKGSIWTQPHTHACRTNWIRPSIRKLTESTHSLIFILLLGSVEITNRDTCVHLDSQNFMLHLKRHTLLRYWKFTKSQQRRMVKMSPSYLPTRKLNPHCSQFRPLWGQNFAVVSKQNHHSTCFRRNLVLLTHICLCGHSTPLWNKELVCHFAIWQNSSPKLDRVIFRCAAFPNALVYLSARPFFSSNTLACFQPFSDTRIC